MRKLLLLLLLFLLPVYSFGATGDAETVLGKTDTALSTLIGKTGTGISTILGKNYTDGDSACYGGSATGLLLYQNFETTAESCTSCAEDNSETWTKTVAGTGSITVDDTTATVLRGSQQLKIVGDSGAGYTYITSPTITGTSPAYGSYRFRTTDGRTGSVQYNFGGFNGTTNLFYVGINATGYVYCIAAGGTGVSATTDQLPDNDSGTRYIWWDWTKSATTATINVYIADSRTKPASPTCTSNNGNQNLDLNNVKAIALNSQTHYFDHILTDNANIGDLCE